MVSKTSYNLIAPIETDHLLYKIDRGPCACIYIRYVLLYSRRAVRVIWNVLSSVPVKQVDGIVIRGRARARGELQISHLNSSTLYLIWRRCLI
jgi:hypothetical protein